MSESPYLSVVIPAYNESHRIEATLSAVQHYLEGRAYSYEVIVVDDGSRDDTVARVQALAAHSPISATYAGGARSLADLEAVEEAGQGRVHLTIGSALDIFGGNVKYEDCVAFNLRRGRA